MSFHVTRIETGLPDPSMLPPQVFVSADQAIIDQLPWVYEAAYLGVADVINHTTSRPPVQCVGSEWEPGRPYGGVAWFTDRSRVQVEESPVLVRNPQILWNRIRNDLANDPTRRIAPHIGYMLLAEDMTALTEDGYANFVFGASDKWIYQSVQSINRFTMPDSTTVESLFRTTRHMARHETAHLLGLDALTIRNHDERGGLYTHHCTNDCTMHQVMNVTEAEVLSEYLEDKPNAGFCDDCITVVRSR